MRDVRYAARTLWHARGWSAVVVVSLALGIGANTALFSAANGLLLRKLPVRDPDSIVRIRSAGPNHVRTDVLTYGHTAPDAQGRDVGSTFSYPMYLEFVAANRTLSDVFVCAPIGTVSVVANGRAEIASALLSSGNLYHALGVTADVGRTIVPDDDRPSAPPAAVISRKYWASRFGSDPNIVGTQIRVNNAPVTIVGVLPRSFTGVNRVVDEAPDVAMPIALQPQVMLQPSVLQASLLNAPNFWWVEVMGRLKPGATAAQVRDNLAAAFDQTARTAFTSFLSSLSEEWRSRLTPKDLQTPELLVDSGSRGMYEPETASLRTIAVLAAAVILVLLIVCVNVATLSLSRSTARVKELSVRMALGATRTRLVRQLLAESVLLAALGGAMGMMAAYWGGQLLPLTGIDLTHVDWHVFSFAAALSLGAAFISGVVPALRATRDVAPALKQVGTGATRPTSRLGKSLVVGQVTISVMLLVAAGLLVRTVWNLQRVDVGFNPRNLVLFRLSPALNRYDVNRTAQLYPRIAERLERIAGVRSVAWSNNSLMSGRTFGTQIFVPGRDQRNGSGDRISSLSVSPGFFATMEMRIVAGRGFASSDTKDAPPAAVINEAAARAFFAGRQAVGRHVGSNPIDTSIEVVGVVGDAKYNAIRTAAEPTIYRSFFQGNPGTATFEVRTMGDPRAAMAEIREAVRDVDPSLPLINLTTGTEEIEAHFAEEKLFARAYSFFAALAIAIAAVGLFGLMSYSVTQRTREIGVRMALGAARGDVVAMVVGESMMIVAAGVALGVAGAAAASRLIATLLFGLAPTDPATIAVATAAMLVLSTLACCLPARRASLVEPLVALRYE